MIWLYILAAVVLSYFFCKNDCVNPKYFVLILFPIEMFGISVGGVTLKPYMIVGIVLIILYFQKNGMRLKKSIFALCLLPLLSDVLTGMSIGSIMAHLMFVFNVLISYCIIGTDEDIDLHSLSSVTIATVLGYGCIFLIAAILLRFNIDILGLVTTERKGVGLFLKQYSGVAYYIRMRGFSIDPNTFVVAYLVGGMAAIYRTITRNNLKWKNIFASSMFLLIIIQSESRMALLCFALIVIFSLVYSIRANTISKNVFLGIGVLLIMAFFVGLMNGEAIRNFYVDYFTNRASLDDQSGRFTIWTTKLATLIQTNKIWLGVGQDQMKSLGGTAGAFHNTWLEWIGGCGFFIGGSIVMWFIFTAVKGTMKLKQYVACNPELAVLIVGYWSIVICISSVSDIANINYIFWAIVIRSKLAGLRRNVRISDGS